MQNTNWGKPGDPVPSVDVEDLKTAWRSITETHRRALENEDISPDDQVGYDLVCFKSQFKGTDIGALSFRWMLLGLPNLIKNPQKMQEWFKTEPSETVFKAAATFPTTWPTDEKLPFDLNEFLHLCEAA